MNDWNRSIYSNQRPTHYHSVFGAEQKRRTHQRRLDIISCAVLVLALILCAGKAAGVL